MLKYLIVTVLLLQACGSAAPVILEGNPGKDGIDGKDAAPNPTLAVQFCPGYTTTYPTTFPEFGFVISDKLYAVYWDGHNAWMAEIPPGVYMSTSTSAPCNFTVNADGTITN